MADMRTRAGPESSVTSIESPSFTLVTLAMSTGSGLGGSAAEVIVANARSHKLIIFLCMGGGLAQPSGKKTFAERGDRRRRFATNPPRGFRVMSARVVGHF